MIKKSFRFALGALLFGAGLSVAAQTGFVQLSDTEKTQLTWDKFAERVNSDKYPVAVLDPDSKVALNFEAAKKTYFADVEQQNSLTTEVANAKVAYNDSYNDYKLALDKLTLAGLSNEKVPAPWLLAVKDSATNFQADYNYPNLDKGSQISYKPENAGRGIILNVAFDKLPDDNTDWKTVGQEKFYEFFSETTKISTLRIYLGPEYKAIAEKTSATATEYYSVNTFTYNDLTVANQIVGALETLAGQSAFQVDGNADVKAEYQSIIDGYTTADEDLWGTDADGKPRNRLQFLQSKVNALESDLATVTTKITTEETGSKALYDAARDAYNTALSNLQDETTNAYIAAYNNVTLTGDITANVQIIQGYSGIINANNHVINIDIPDNQPLFKTIKINNLPSGFAGVLKNAAINGVFAETTDRGSFVNVAYANTVEGFYRYYDANGALTTAKSIGELGLVARDNLDNDQHERFGVNLLTDKVIMPASDAVKVYQITVYDRVVETDANNNDIIYVDNVTDYVNRSGDNLVNKANTKGIITPNDNIFFSSSTNDTDLQDIDNYIYTTGGLATCNNVVITDKKPFFCPMDLKAGTTTYNRSLVAGYNSVCLPFDLKKSVLGSGVTLCTYKGQTDYKIEFEEVESVPANTPALIYAETACTFSVLNNSTIKMTGSQVKVNNGQSYGTFREVTLSDLKTISGSEIYGLAPKKDGSGYQFAHATGNSKFPSFRMLIANEVATQNLAPRAIGIFDGDGNDITADITGIKSDKVDAASLLNIVGGLGEIVISSESDFGDVTVYTIDGKVVAVADVVAGTTTINVNKGFYIVNGQKVVVK